MRIRGELVTFYEMTYREMAQKWFQEVSKFLASNVITLFHKQYAFIDAVDHELNNNRIYQSVKKKNSNAPKYFPSLL